MAKKETAKEIITRARAGLVVDAPFWASILLKLEMEEDKDGIITDTMATNGEKIVYYPGEVESNNLFKVKGTLAHEVGHVVLLHPYRRGTRDPFLWNVACDYAINPIILDAGFELPEGSLVDDRFRNMEVEAIYAVLEKQGKKPGEKPGTGGGGAGGQGKSQGQGKPGKDPGQGKGPGKPGKDPGKPPQVPDPGRCGGVFDAPHKTKEELKAKEEERKIDIQQAVQVAKRQGKLPGGLERFVEKVLEPVIDWREKLAQFVDTYSKNDYSWQMPNRRFTGMGFYLPQLRSPELGNVIVMIDASGSVSPGELRALVSEAKGITEFYEGVTLHTIFFDTVADKPLEITVDTDVTKLRVRKGGGTDYRPGFKMIEEAGMSPVCIVVLTDGCCNSFPKHSPAPVLWVLNQKYEYFKPPFGDTVIMEREGGDDE